MTTAASGPGGSRIRWRLVGVLAAVGAGHACGRCGGDPPVCDPCDPVALLLDDSDALKSGELAALSSSVESFCTAHTVDERIRDAWLGEECWELTAHYLVRTLRWDITLEQEYRAQTHATFACPGSDGSGSLSPGCPAPPQSFDIVGPAELEIEAQSPIAMLITTAQLDETNDAALATALPETIAAALDGDNCDGPQWVAGVSCTAFLVGPRHVLTARHCLGDTPVTCGGEADDRLANKSLVFDYLAHPQEDTTIVGGLTVVACGTEDGAATVADARDWALLRLDEAPPGNRVPLALPAPGASPSACEPLYVLGHPLGHPQFRGGSSDPATPSAWIRRTPSDGLIQTTLDIIVGFSGAPVFTLEGDRLVGLVVGGKFVLQTTGCDWVFECGSAGCPSDWDYGRAVDLAAIADQLAPHLRL